MPDLTAVSDAARQTALAVCQRIGADPAGPIGQRLIAACGRLSPDGLAQTAVATAGWANGGAPPPDPLRRLLDEATNRETYFFRDRNQLLLLQELLAERGRAGGPAAVWSAGCATGEEPYSVAILLTQIPGLAGVSVLGTDLSGAALATAAAATYRTGPMSSCRSLKPEDDACLPAAGERRRQVAAAIRSNVRFREHNILSGVPENLLFDAVLCRNVMIYMEPASRRDCMGVLDRALKPGGVLLTGPGDPAPPGGYQSVFRNNAMAFIKGAVDAC